ncbi:MAG: helix-turn-helix domain-containing protein [Chloroflexota bacterium]|jgi:hypothetical protein
MLAFGARLLRLRLAAPAPTVSGGLGRYKPRRILPATALSRMAGLTPSYVTLVEGGRRTPSRAGVLRLAEALGCSDLDRDLLLVAAGHWPWPDADDATTELLVAVCAAILAGDYRPLTQDMREVRAMGVR